MYSGFPLNCFEKLGRGWDESEKPGKWEKNSRVCFLTPEIFYTSSIFISKPYACIYTSANSIGKRRMFYLLNQFYRELIIGLFLLRKLCIFQATDKPNPVFESIVWQIPDITGVGNNITINDTSVLSKLIAPDLASAQNYFTYKGSLTTPPCLEIVQWIDFVQPQYISHEQVFRKLLSLASI